MQICSLQWDEVIRARDQLQKQQRSSAGIIKTRRLVCAFELNCFPDTDTLFVSFLSGFQRAMKVTSPDSTRELPHGPSATAAVCPGSAAPGHAGTNMVCLNSSSPTESTSTACEWFYIYVSKSMSYVKEEDKGCFC